MGIAERISKAMLELLENQIRSQNPPEARQAYERLVQHGYSPGEARQVLGRVIAEFVSENLRLQREFDPRAYARALSELPSSFQRTG